MTSVLSTSALAANRIAFLGTGSMNGAVLRGIIATGYDPRAIVATLRSNAKAHDLHAETGVTVLVGEHDPEANGKAARDADIVFLGVKPVGIAALCDEIRDVLKPTAVVVSVAAAITIEMIAAHLAPGQPVVRSMPNTPLKVGVGAVGLSTGETVSEAALAAVVDLFAGSGVVHVVPESQQDAVSAISGSGPAYAFYLAEAMAAAGVKLGLDPALATDLARATVAGAGKMLADPQADPSALRRGVSSPNGTTVEALAVFDAEDLAGIVARGAAAAAARAAAITRELA
ncbi:pyrroline-5-carboxylate reductase [Paeniglutamicibacter psychrophenolicus]|uniref:pyrroline-5-carboxylate reductase n=1 Tax=Paeniglutamicibacter psychrophenolicus TaxID=257454 RepID=UPI002783747B|nr:pyrroline-5-carboxylate reductase [Paeniglutamicibacter psychrophenolicus]MDQ0095530.1 pyrroline-5-carboxylate reductase [Paeniglutamicibacter psychrophenolicus]